MQGIPPEDPRTTPTTFWDGSQLPFFDHLHQLLPL
jgi:hypothetical protein